MQRDRYKWDGDSHDERESEFSETAFSTTTAGVFHSTWAQDRVRIERKPRLAGWLWPLLIAVGSSATVLYFIARHLRG